MTQISGLELMIGFAGIVGTVLLAIALTELLGGAVTAIGWWLRVKVETALGQRE